VLSILTFFPLLDILVLEKFEKLREMMLSHGMQLWHYNLTNYIFFATLYTFIGAFFWVSGIGFSLRFFSDTHWSTLLVWFVGWGLAVISLAFFLSSLINSPRASTIVGYATALLGSMIGIIVAVGIYGPTPFAVARRVPTWILMWPQFAFVRALFLMNDACAEKHLCVGPVWTLPFDDELTACLIALFVAAVVYFILFLYLDAVLPRQYGVPKHPLFIFFAIAEVFGSCCKKGPSADSLRRLQNKERIDEAEESEARMLSREDDDVSLERRKVHLHEYNLARTPLVMNDLRKVYDEASPPKIAVKNLCLTVAEGECFGLLGENGAGKSTTISTTIMLFRS
jgi:ABC-type multidrug transport system fused ATPase/permease subunit